MGKKERREGIKVSSPISELSKKVFLKSRGEKIRM